ncbi:MAG: hypothetical protein IJ419_10365 [Agathobacter sp.]|nr:hypothetical protein [Agathobacter sp.]
MINEERVKQLYKIALYEQKEEKVNRQIGQYYKSDFVGKELIKSIFTGTLAFGCFAILWMLGSWEDVLDSINNLEIVGIAIELLIMYGVFLVIYLGATYIVYGIRYEVGKKKIKTYTDDLKTAHKMYEREEKLKM